MTAPFEAAGRVGRRSSSTVRTERLRALLLVVMERQTAEFERHAETLRGADRESTRGHN